MTVKTAKTLLAATLLLSGGWFGVASPAPAIAYDYDEDDYAAADFFYQDLARFGEWVEVRRYGRCWRPWGVSSHWRPYTDGHWEYTEFGWTWVPDEPWGWAPYHYGRWFYEPTYGWLWVPGREWAPAWVVWRRGGGWIGWAPAPPRWRPGRVVVDRFIEPRHYCFIEERRFADPRIRDHLVVSRRNPDLVRVTNNVTNYTIVENHVVNNSIHVEDVEKVAGRPIPRHRVDEFEQAVPRQALQAKAPEKERVAAPPAEVEPRDPRGSLGERQEHGAAFNREPADSRELRRGREIDERAAERRELDLREQERRMIERHDIEQRAAERRELERRELERRTIQRGAVQQPPANHPQPERGSVERRETDRRIEERAVPRANIERAPEPVHRPEPPPQVEQRKQEERHAVEPRHEAEQPRRLEVPRSVDAHGGKPAEAHENRPSPPKAPDAGQPGQQPAGGGAAAGSFR